MALSGIELEMVALVAHRLLQFKEPTSQILLIKRYNDPDLIDKLTPVILKSPDGERVWPGVLAFELCGDADALRFARKSFEVVVHTLQSLFSDKEVERTHFSLSELEDRARELFGAIQLETIMFGLYFIQEFPGIHAGMGGVFPNFTTVVIHRRIGLLKNVPGTWDDLVSKYGPYLEQNFGLTLGRKEAGS